MTLQQRVSIIAIAVVAAFTSCKEEPKKEVKKSAIEFSIPGAKEEVKLTHPDGTHKLSVYTDEATHQKVAEVEFHPNGQPKINKKFVNETLNGESWCYYENGKPWSLNTFRDGLYDGPYKTWHDNGQANIVGQYVNGKEEGEWFTYYPTGTLNTRGIYREGKKVGVWSSYNLQGTLKREQDFTSGEKK